MVWESREAMAKIDRIKELTSLGLNTPRMYFVPHEYTTREIEDAMEWAKNIHTDNNKQIFNIRTYARTGFIETLQTKHICDIKFEKLRTVLLDTLAEYNCMIDAETPDNGRYAGDIFVEVNEFKRPKRAIFTYCKREKRAMVRDADQSLIMELMKKDYEKELCYELLYVLNKVMITKKFETIFEWTWFCKPTGVLNENVVFWEWRSY